MAVKTNVRELDKGTAKDISENEQTTSLSNEWEAEGASSFWVTLIHTNLNKRQTSALKR